MPPSYSWLKLYYEILDDPKMGRLPDRLWRRVVECFLLAGRNGNTGQLPDVCTMAWALRVDEDTLTVELQSISKIGIIEHTKDGWKVKNFSKRQAATEASERMSQMRNRKRYETVTARIPEVEEEVEVEVDKEVEAEGDKNFAAAAALFESNISLLTPILADDLKDAISEFSGEWVGEAIKETAKNGARSFKYTRAILERWRKDGYKVDSRKNGVNGGNGNGRKAQYQDIAGQELARILREEKERGN